MKTSPAGLGLIEASEGLRLQVYKDVAGLPTIGYGHLLRQGESFPNGITTLQAQLMLEADAGTCAPGQGSAYAGPV
jgi:lysozyme